MGSLLAPWNLLSGTYIQGWLPWKPLTNPRHRDLHAVSNFNLFCICEDMTRWDYLRKCGMQSKIWLNKKSIWIEWKHASCHQVAIIISWLQVHEQLNGYNRSLSSHIRKHKETASNVRLMNCVKLCAKLIYLITHFASYLSQTHDYLWIH